MKSIIILCMFLFWTTEAWEDYTDYFYDYTNAENDDFTNILATLDSTINLTCNQNSLTSIWRHGQEEYVPYVTVEPIVRWWKGSSIEIEVFNESVAGLWECITYGRPILLYNVVIIPETTVTYPSTQSTKGIVTTTQEITTTSSTTQRSTSTVSTTSSTTESTSTTQSSTQGSTMKAIINEMPKGESENLGGLIEYQFTRSLMNPFIQRSLQNSASASAPSAINNVIFIGFLLYFIAFVISFVV